MCYSAQIEASYQKYVRAFGADIGIATFVRLYFDRAKGSGAKIPKGMDAAFLSPASDWEREIKALIEAHDAQAAGKLEQEVFKQKKRLADAERIVQSKTTKKAIEDRRIATAKIEWALGKLADLRRTRPEPRDSRIFPGMHAPVLVWEDGRRVVKPMRYQCRPAGKPAFFDRKFPGTYNARRDNLEGFWKDAFGLSHGLMVASRFYENVPRHRVEGRELGEGEKEENVILEFAPRDGSEMLIACLWSRWTGGAGEPELLSFAAITDAPEPEVAAAGHDRTVINIKPEHIDAWLNPEPGNLAALYAIFDDRRHPYYEHRMAA
jgi:putative SOS response-associated peptidase YedK